MHLVLDNYVSGEYGSHPRTAETVTEIGIFIAITTEIFVESAQRDQLICSDDCLAYFGSSVNCVMLILMQSLAQPFFSCQPTPFACPDSVT